MNGPFGAAPPRQARTTVSDPLGGVFRGLYAENNASTPNTKIDIGATAIVLEDANYNSYLARSVALTVDSAVAGAGGVESGTTVSGANWYARHIIANPWTGSVKGLLSTSATAPILPAGYTYWACTGWHRTTSGNFYGIRQRGRVAQYVVGLGQTGSFPTIANGAAGTFSTTSPVLANASVSTFVPTTAIKIVVCAGNNFAANSAASVLVTTNTSMGGTNNGPAGSNGLTWPIYLISAASGQQQASFLIEGTNIAWCSSGSGGAIACQGWEDNF